MTLGVGGSTKEQALAKLSDMTTDVQPIQLAEYQQRIAKAQSQMQQQGIDAIYLNAGTNLYYFTGLSWGASERMVGALLPAKGEIRFIAPHFEVGSITDKLVIQGQILCWHEHESPYLLFHTALEELVGSAKRSGQALVGLDESTAFFMVDAIQKAGDNFNWCNAAVVTNACRKAKSANEIALIQRAMDMTIEVHKAAASILHQGISTTEVEEFINEAHKAVGAAGSYFVIALFGEASQYPHGVKDPQLLNENDIVLIDTGCKLFGYTSDITRTYVFGKPNERQTQVWNAERKAQQAAFDAAQIGKPCESADLAARASLIEDGFGPDYNLPGLPHRTGHGLGIDIHEGPYLVKGNKEPLAKGMCFSNEPMLVVPGEFGVRLEDHFYMSEDGPCWFTQPSPSIDNPLGY